MQKLISTCPACHGKMVITTLTCPDCGIELRGQFEAEDAQPVSLSGEDDIFLTCFLKNRGNMKQVQEEMRISYPTAKKRLDQALKVLGLYTEEGEKEREVLDVAQWNVDETSGKASEIIKRKLKECGGRAAIRSYTGKEYEIWVMPDGKSFGCDGLADVTPEFEIFDMVVDHLREQGGVAKKGNARYRLGAKECGVDTVSGAILQKYYQVPMGGTGFDPVFIVCAMLEWAGLAKNARGELILEK